METDNKDIRSLPIESSLDDLLLGEIGILCLKCMEFLDGF